MNCREVLSEFILEHKYRSAQAVDGLLKKLKSVPGQQPSSDNQKEEQIIAPLTSMQIKWETQARLEVFKSTFFVLAADGFQFSQKMKDFRQTLNSLYDHFKHNLKNDLDDNQKQLKAEIENFQGLSDFIAEKQQSKFIPQQQEEIKKEVRPNQEHIPVAQTKLEETKMQDRKKQSHVVKEPKKSFMQVFEKELDEQKYSLLKTLDNLEKQLPQASAHNDLKIKMATKAASIKAAFIVLKKLRDNMLNGQWNAGLFTRAAGLDDDMLPMLEAIQTARSKDPNGVDQIWLDTFEQVNKLGQNAAQKQGSHSKQVEKFFAQFTPEVKSNKPMTEFEKDTDKYLKKHTS